MESTFEWHQQNPDISLDAYVKARRVVLGESLSAKKLIYLDTNYWITLHEAAEKAAQGGRGQPLTYDFEVITDFLRLGSGKGISRVCNYGWSFESERRTV
jgi:hypothetical protein